MGSLNIILAVAVAFTAAAIPVAAFTSTRCGAIPSLQRQRSAGSFSRLYLQFGWPGSKEVSNGNAIVDAKSLIEESIANTDRGRSLESSQRTSVHSLLSNLEEICPISQPARDKRMEGPWIVLYTDAPPPSNGQLGFLKGIAKQVIDLPGRRYRNELYVGGSGADGDEDAWLTAVLDAKWEEWDGTYLDESGGTADVKDPGATTWKVDFETLKLSLFGLPLFTQQFKAGTSRTWRMSYLDDDTRIVRAGKTGKGEDDWIFYMRRGS